MCSAGEEEWQRLMLAQRSFPSCAQVRPVFCFPDAAAIYSPVLLLFCPYPLWSTQCLHLKRAALCSSLNQSQRLFLNNLRSESQAQKLPGSPCSGTRYIYVPESQPGALQPWHGSVCGLCHGEFFSFLLRWSCAVFFTSFPGWAGDVAQLGEDLPGMYNILGFTPGTT